LAPYASEVPPLVLRKLRPLVCSYKRSRKEKTLKLSIQAVAKMTGLRESTVRQYAWQKKLGKLEGRSKVFTLAEAKKIGGLKDDWKAKSARKKLPAVKKAARARPKKNVPAASSKEPTKVEQKAPMEKRQSFWALLGIGKKPRAKVSLMQTTMKK